MPGGGVRTQNSFIRAGSAPGSNYLPFYIPFLEEKEPPPPFVYLLLRIPKCTVFEM